MINTNTDTNVATDLTTIQVLVPLVLSAENDGNLHTWLSAFCLMTITPGPGTVQLTGQVHIGYRYDENTEMVQHLADALDPTAALAGYDLDNAIAQLGQLPSDSTAPAPSLEVLEKLQAMTEHQLPLDVGCDEDTRFLVHANAVVHGLKMNANPGQGNLDQLALSLRDRAGAIVIALGDLYIPAALQPHLIAAWQRWHRTQVPVFPSVPERRAP